MKRKTPTRVKTAKSSKGSHPPSFTVPPALSVLAPDFLQGWWGIKLTGVYPCAPRPPWPLPPDPGSGKPPRPYETRLVALIGSFYLGPLETNGEGSCSFTGALSHGGEYAPRQFGPWGQGLVIGTYKVRAETDTPLSGWLQLEFRLPDSETKTEFEFVIVDGGKELFLIMSKPALRRNYPPPGSGSPYPSLGGVLSGTAKRC